MKVTFVTKKGLIQTQSMLHSSIASRNCYEALVGAGDAPFSM